MRTIKFIVGEYYHIYNRGTDKRIIFNDKWDLERFFQSMIEFNTTDSIGSIYQSKYHKKETLSTRGTKLVDFICYSLNPNHYHFILTPLVENGIEKFIHKLGGGYTRYFNEKNKRTGVLFQGAYKAIHI
ncbi:MAG: transposase, partial [Candidatus Pacebacteria bacterium]|nr:transposase [Candidatus Paceibacterota bacterium]